MPKAIELMKKSEEELLKLIKKISARRVEKAKLELIEKGLVRRLRYH